MRLRDFEFGSGWRLELGSNTKADDVAVEVLREGLVARYSITLEATGRARGQGKVIALAIRPGSVEIGKALDKNKTALKDQAYRLELGTARITITANAPTGLLYGVETLVQLVKLAEGKPYLPEGTVTD